MANVVDDALVNRVANSSLITINLEDFFPKNEIVAFDVKDYLFQGLILKEKDFRAELKAHDWTKYQKKHLAIYCSQDAIIPVWAYMLVTAHAQPYAEMIYLGTPRTFLDFYFSQCLSSFDGQAYEGKRIVIKGCSNNPVPVSAYLEITRILRPFAQSIMYGEPCSTVPIFKRPRKS